jgi:hypothetical protein
MSAIDVFNISYPSAEFTEKQQISFEAQTVQNCLSVVVAERHWTPAGDRRGYNL